MFKREKLFFIFTASWLLCLNDSTLAGHNKNALLKLVSIGIVSLGAPVVAGFVLRPFPRCYDTGLKKIAFSGAGSMVGFVLSLFLFKQNNITPTAVFSLLGFAGVYKLLGMEQENARREGGKKNSDAPGTQLRRKSFGQLADQKQKFKVEKQSDGVPVYHESANKVNEEQESDNAPKEKAQQTNFTNNMSNTTNVENANVNDGPKTQNNEQTEAKGGRSHANDTYTKNNLPETIPFQFPGTGLNFLGSVDQPKEEKNMFGFDVLPEDNNAKEGGAIFSTFFDNLDQKNDNNESFLNKFLVMSPNDNNFNVAEGEGGKISLTGSYFQNETCALAAKNFLQRNDFFILGNGNPLYSDFYITVGAESKDNLAIDCNSDKNLFPALLYILKNECKRVLSNNPNKKICNIPQLTSKHNSFTEAMGQERVLFSTIPIFKVDLAGIFNYATNNNFSIGFTVIALLKEKGEINFGSENNFFQDQQYCKLLLSNVVFIVTANNTLEAIIESLKNNKGREKGYILPSLQNERERKNFNELQKFHFNEYYKNRFWNANEADAFKEIIQFFVDSDKDYGCQELKEIQGFKKESQQKITIKLDNNPFDMPKLFLNQQQQNNQYLPQQFQQQQQPYPPQIQQYQQPPQFPQYVSNPLDAISSSFQLTVLNAPDRRAAWNVLWSQLQKQYPNSHDQTLIFNSLKENFPQVFSSQ